MTHEQRSTLPRALTLALATWATNEHARCEQARGRRLGTHPPDGLSSPEREAWYLDRGRDASRLAGEARAFQRIASKIAESIAAWEAAPETLPPPGHGPADHEAVAFPLRWHQRRQAAAQATARAWRRVYLEATASGLDAVAIQLSVARRLCRIPAPDAWLSPAARVAVLIDVETAERELGIGACFALAWLLDGGAS